MEFLLVGESKLKIVMGEDEMKKYRLENFSLDGDNAATRRSFWQLLDLAKAEVGFDPSGDKVLIQFYPIKCGGCEVFVTKLGILAPTSAKLVSKSDKVAMLSRNKKYYAFQGLAELVAALSAIKVSAGEVSAVSDVYISDNHGYYLSLEEYGKGGESAEFPMVQEFGRALTADMGIYISEHFRRLTNGDAIDKFSKR